MKFWDSEAWSMIMLLGTLLFSMLVANLLKKSVRFLRVSLIPTSVLGGLILLIISTVYQLITGTNIFDTPFYGGNGREVMEILTYHALALGFIATTYKPSKGKMSKQRNVEIFNSGVTTVASYLLQAILGLGLTIVLSLTLMKSLFPASGVLLPFGYGQGTGQALNYGTIYEEDYGFAGGAHFGLTVAALGFLSAAIGGVIHLNILRRKGKIGLSEEDITEALNSEQIQSSDEIPMNGSIDKMTVQIAIVVVTYICAYGLMYVLSALIPSFRSVLYGFNFLLGVLCAVLIQKILSVLHKHNVVKKEYINPFLMKRIGGFCFDVMIVAGIAAIDLTLIAEYWAVLLVMGLIGAFSTYFYNYFIAKKFFPDYTEAQFLAMYGMLTGTASTGMILLREVDPEFKTPAADNLVYLNLPAIVFGFPMMLLATLAPKQPYLTLILLGAFFLVMNIILFRSCIFKKKK